MQVARNAKRVMVRIGVHIPVFYRSMCSSQVALQNQGNAKGLVSPITSPGVAYEVVCVRVTFTVADRSGAGEMAVVVTTPRACLVTPSPLRPGEHVRRPVR